MDIFFSALVAAAAIALGWLGLVLTLHPIQPHEHVRAGRYKAAFLLLSAFGFFMVIVQGARNQNSQDDMRKENKQQAEELRVALAEIKGKADRPINVTSVPYQVGAAISLTAADIKTNDRTLTVSVMSHLENYGDSRAVGVVDFKVYLDGRLGDMKTEWAREMAWVPKQKLGMLFELHANNNEQYRRIIGGTGTEIEVIVVYDAKPGDRVRYVGRFRVDVPRRRIWTISDNTKPVEAIK